MAHRSSWRELLRPPHALSTAVVVLGVLTPSFGWFITNTVLPSVVADVGGLALYAWVSIGYSAASILGTAGVAVAQRRVGMRAALVSAAAVFAVGALACAAAPSMPALIAGRALQGLGGGMLIAAVHGLLRQAFPEPLWPRVLASISFSWGIAALTGPSVGGVLAGRGHWRGAFAAMILLAALGAVLTWRLLGPAAPVSQPAERGVPLARLGLTCAGIFCVASVGNVTATPARLALLGGAVGLIALALRLDEGSRVRLFPTAMLSVRRPLGRAFWMVFCLAMSTTPVTVFLPLFVQVLHGASPALAGYLTAAQSLAWTSAALLFARLGPAGVRRALLLGPLAIGVGFAGLGLLTAAGPLWAVAAFVLLVGGGVGTAWAHVGSRLLASSRPGEEDVTASLIPSTQTVAVALGAAVCGVVANASGLSAGASPASTALAARLLFGVFVAVPLAAAAIALGMRAAEPTRSAPEAMPAGRRSP